MSALVAVVAARGAGERYVLRRPHLLSARARRLGLETRADVDAEFAAARSGWSRGTEYHCPFHDKDFVSPSGARKHMRVQGCVVIRTDYYPELAGHE